MGKPAEKVKGYNGWSNYETWLFALWFDNEEGPYHERCETGQRLWEEAEDSPRQYCDRSQTARIAFAARLKGWVEENQPDLGASFWADILGAALSEIDYHEIADNWLSEIEEYERREA